MTHDEDDLDEIVRKQDARKALIDQFIALGPRSFEIEAKNWPGLIILVHPDSHDRRRGKWRATRFEGGEAVGHTEYEDFPQAVRDVMDAYRCDPSRAKRY
jgi:hypothetical protein